MNPFNYSDLGKFDPKLNYSESLYVFLKTNVPKLNLSQKDLSDIYNYAAEQLSDSRTNTHILLFQNMVKIKSALRSFGLVKEVLDVQSISDKTFLQSFWNGWTTGIQANAVTEIASAVKGVAIGVNITLAIVSVGVIKIAFDDLIKFFIGSIKQVLQFFLLTGPFWLLSFVYQGWQSLIDTEASIINMLYFVLSALVKYCIKLHAAKKQFLVLEAPRLPSVRKSPPKLFDETKELKELEPKLKELKEPKLEPEPLFAESQSIESLSKDYGLDQEGLTKAMVAFFINDPELTKRYTADTARHDAREFCKIYKNFNLEQLEKLLMESASLMAKFS
jgi:hypothetical protein